MSKNEKFIDHMLRSKRTREIENIGAPEEWIKNFVNQLQQAL